MKIKIIFKKKSKYLLSIKSYETISLNKRKEIKH
jgi:hypothetical protein